jgi:hypothetical protein
MMSRITINTLSSVETLNRAAMAETSGGLLFPFRSAAAAPSPLLLRPDSFFLFRRRVCVPVFPFPSRSPSEPLTPEQPFARRARGDSRPAFSFCVGRLRLGG